MRFRLPLVSLLLCVVPSLADAAPAARLAGERDLGNWGGVPFLADLDGDGRTDSLWLQSAGMFASLVFQEPQFRGRLSISEAERKLFCLTAVNSEGKQLWRIGEPWTGDRPFITHSSERSLAVADIDGDGQVEVIAVRNSELLVIDGRTGKVKRSTPLDFDNMQIVVPARAGTSAGDWLILVQNAETAYLPYDYANPAMFFSPDLVLRKTMDYLGAGHTPQAGDFDGDGQSEFLVGFNRVDWNLRTRWTFQPVERSKWNGQEMHVDALSTGVLQGRKVVAFAASQSTYVVDPASGALLWKRDSSHPQQCHVGRFRKGDPANQLLVINKRGNVDLLSGDGRLLWTLDPPAHDPAGRSPHARQRFHVFDPVVRVAGSSPRQPDLAIYSDNGWPYLIDGEGQAVFAFPMPSSARQDYGPVPGRPDDYGYGYYVRHDVPAGRIQISDRRHAWLFDLPNTN